MRKIIVAICFVLTLVLVSCVQLPKNQNANITASPEKTEDPEDTPKLAFDSSKDLVEILNRELYQKGFAELGTMETHYRSATDGWGCIIEGYLVGDSTQVKFTDLDKNVITKFVVTKINHLGSNVSMKVGDEIYVIEPYYYVEYDSKETDKYLAGTILAKAYYPMERNQTYVIFGVYEPDVTFNQITADVFAVQQYPFSITANEPHKDIYKDEYTKLWYDVKAKYGK